VSSGNHVIGNWALDDIDITTGPEGVHVSAEGEELILQLSEMAAFEEAAGLNGHKSASSITNPFKLPRLSKEPKHASSSRSTSTRSDEAQRPTTPGKAPAPALKAPAPTSAKPVKLPKEPGFLDRTLERAENAVGGRLPSWIFTRGGAFLIVAALAVAIILPALVSTLLMLAGVLVLVLGGVTMLDVVLAARLLKSKVTPTQTLIGGGALVLLGLLVGMLA